MATTQNTYTGNGSTTNYSFTFEYLKQADVKVTLDTVATTAFTFANATTIAFTSAPANSVAIRIFRDTAIDTLSSTFFSGSAIKAEDLNQNFTQSLYVTQESETAVGIADTTANTASTNASAAVTTANSANTKSDAAVTTANTASTNASAAVTTANTASTNATTAVNTANTATTTANSAVTTANTATTTANGAVTTANAATTTANTASTNASAAVTTANTANTAADNAVTTANSAVNTANGAVTTANGAVTTANTASTNASAAVTTANTADTNASAAVVTANAASAAVSTVALFTLAANVAAIPGSPSDNDSVEIGDSTGIESFTPLSGLPSGFTGASGLTVRIRYDNSASSWVFMNYFANDSEDRYFQKTSGNTNTTNIATNVTNIATNVTNIATNVTNIAARLPLAGGTLTGDLTIPDKIIHRGDTNTAVRFPANDTVSVETAGTERMRIDSSGNVGIGRDSPQAKLDVDGDDLGSTAGDSVSLGRFSGGTNTTTGGNSSQFSISNERILDGNTWETGSIRLQRVVDATPMQYIDFTAVRGTSTNARDTAFGQGTTERMRITEQGNVGIGTSSPSRSLEIKTGTGIAGFKQSSSPLATTLEFLRNGVGTISNNAIEVSNSSGIAASINYSGGAYFGADVGIGTDSPDAQLVIFEPVGSSTPAKMKFVNAGDRGLTVGFKDHNAAPDFAISNGDQTIDLVVIDAAGNVGIGTDNPQEKLDVNGSATFAGNVTLPGGGGATQALQKQEIEALTVSTFNNDSGYITLGEVPTPPAAGNGALTIKTAGQGANSTGTFTANQSAGSILTLPVIRYQDVSGTPSIPAAANNGQINVNAGTGLSASGTQATANQSGNTTRTLSLNTTYTDGRYVNKTGDTMTGDLELDNADIILYDNVGNPRVSFQGNGGTGFFTNNVSCSRITFPTTAGTFAWNWASTAGGTLTQYVDTTAVGKLVYSTSNNITLYWDSFGQVVAVVDGTASVVLGTSSDYRLKENDRDCEYGTDAVKALRPVSYTLKDSGAHAIGFIAHEAAEVIPGAATGEKDGEMFQSINTYPIVATLTKALQESIERIEALEAKVQTLENN